MMTTGTIGRVAAIRGRDARGIGVHRAVAIGNDVEEVLRRRGAQAVDVKRWRPRKTALDDHAAAVAHASVAGGAEVLEPLASPREKRNVDWRRGDVDRRARHD